VEYRPLGRTGVKVSAFCLGAMMFGDWGNTDETECIRMVHEALEGGINFVDTADVYSRGRSEETVGKALKDRRDDVVLATKVHGPMGDGLNEQGNSRLWIEREVDNSLRRLQTDHIDLYQIHRPDPDTDLGETLDVLTDLVRKGKIRYAGCSTFPAWQIAESRWIADRGNLTRFATEQPPYSIFVRHIELDVLPVAQRYGMGVIVWSPLAGGWLTGKYRRGQDVPTGSRAERYAERFKDSPVSRRFDMSRPGNQRKLDVVEELAKIAANAGVSMTDLAHAFVLTHPGVTSAIIGPRTSEQLQEVLAGAETKLDADRGWSPPWLEAAARRRL
jgi:aryl-alcohol dehydrogenase-like predicted oxidoreductase